VRLRGRFTLWFALAALVPITVAALVTRYMLARSYRDEHARTRIDTEAAVRASVAELQRSVQGPIAEDALGSRDHEVVGGLLRELVKAGGEVDDVALRRFRDISPPAMRGFSLDLLLVTGPRGRVLAAPHYRALIGEDGYLAAERHARHSGGRPFFAWEKVMPGGRPETVLVASAARLVREGTMEVAVQVGRRLDESLVEGVRRPGRIAARVVDARGAEIVAPADPEWARLAAAGTMRIALAGSDGQPVAWVELAVAEGLDELLWQVTWVAGVLAAAALALTVLLGLGVARRMTRDLDRLVEGAQAAARGELEHRVVVSSRDEVEAVAAAFNLMMEDLRAAQDRAAVAERIAAWQEVARRLAHEVKNPLTPIQMAMDTLRRTWRKQHPKFEQVLESSTATVLEEADRLKRIVTEFSEFARMPKLVFGPTDVGEVVASAVALYQGATPVATRLAAGLPVIEADRGQLTQVLLNLVENARDAIASRATPEGGRIVVSTRRGDAGDRVEIAVEDNGPGIPAEVKDRMFTPYFTTKQGQGGTGLGLAIVHRIVSDHGGRVVVGDAPEGGARFVVELPLRPGQALLASRI
jgi:two-component system, NtrC family, nitrogen regulation sensor histidine kinase NtrY